MPKAPLEHLVSYHDPGHIVCRKCGQSLMARVTITPDGTFATCTNRIRKGATNVGCGQRLFLIAGPGFVHAVTVTPEVQKIIDAGGTAADLLRALGIMHDPARAA